MILYLGTSSLIQLYARDKHSHTIRKWVDMAEIVATCRIAYTEVMSAIDDRYRRGELGREEYDTLKTAFSRDWDRYAKLDFDDYEAGDLISKYGLTRLGALHLSAALSLVRGIDKLRPMIETVHKGNTAYAVFFSSIDDNLLRAASAEGLSILSLGL